MNAQAGVMQLGIEDYQDKLVGAVRIWRGSSW
jgi:hypothetical protein